MERRKLTKTPPSSSHPLPRLNFTPSFLPLLPPLSGADGMGNRQSACNCSFLLFFPLNSFPQGPVKFLIMSCSLLG